MTRTLSAATSSLDIAYEQTGPDSGTPIVLLHGFPYNVRQFDEVRDALASPERRIIVPYLRGFGPTRYRTSDVFRSGQQAALGKDVIDLLDALRIGRAILAGYDWGGRAACVAAALWPDRIIGLLSASAYAIQNIVKDKSTPATPQATYARWYQSYFNTPQGEIGLDRNRNELCRFLWRLWSPTWKFTDAEYEGTAASFENPDFVATAIHSYRHRYGNVAGDPGLRAIELQLARQPKIPVPTIVLHGAVDQVEPPESTEGHEVHFTADYRREILAGVGHCVPAEAPEEFSRGIAALLNTSAEE